MNIYHNTKMPIIGWIHGCFNCGTNTACTINYLHENKTHVVYVCRKCEFSTKDNLAFNNLKPEFQEKIKGYIYEKSLEPYKTRIYSMDPPNIPGITGEETPLPESIL